MKLQNFEKGVSIYLALMVMIVLLGIALGISTIIVSQMVMIRGMSDSVIALDAAETGMERALHALYKEDIDFSSTTITYSGSVNINNSGGQDPGDSFYIVKIISPGQENCLADSYCIRSSGTYMNTKRAIEASR